MIMKNHKTELLELNGKKVFIDKGISSLIKEMNELGIKTTQCCEGYNEYNPPHLYFWYGLDVFNQRNEETIKLLNIVKFFDSKLDEVDPCCLIQNIWFNLINVKFSESDLRNKIPRYDSSFAHFYVINSKVFKEKYGYYNEEEALDVFINIWKKLLNLYIKEYLNV